MLAAIVINMQHFINKWYELFEKLLLLASLAGLQLVNAAS